MLGRLSREDLVMTVTDKFPAFLALSNEGAKLAEVLILKLGAGRLYGRAGRVERADIFFDHAVEQLQNLFEEGQPIVAICAAGIVVRALAPLLTDKYQDPPVVVLSEDGSAVVPLLGGHHGANNLARDLAGHLSVSAAVTTASDMRFSVALDEPPRGYRLANPQNYKAFMAALLAGEKIFVRGSAPWISNSDLPLTQRESEAGLKVTVTERLLEGSEKELIFHPAVLSLGIGCERNAPSAVVATLARKSLQEAELSPLAIAAVVSIDLKADETAVQNLAKAFSVPARFFSPETLAQEDGRLENPSETVLAEVGCRGVSEGAALAAVGRGGSLVVPKRKNSQATCAIAKSPTPLDTNSLGVARGRLVIVGLGPGQESWRAPEVEKLVRETTELVGYHLYLDLLGPIGEGKTRHGYELGEEERRVRTALNLAAEGKSVALVCSGDPGIYAMAALTFELLDRGNRPDWSRVDIQLVPGISALQGASARAGALLGHDFCTISLSDLLTPWETIEKRLNAAAQGDFVVAFYNPVSRRRTRQLTRAVEILLKHRPADTPVVLGRNLGREGESVTVLRLDELTSDQVDMLTVVLVGSSTSRRVPKADGSFWAYTPRGYEKKEQLRIDGNGEEIRA